MSSFHLASFFLGWSFAMIVIAVAIIIRDR